jgi:hypothetical protein
MEPESGEFGTRCKSAIVSQSSPAPISVDETTLAISNKTPNGSWKIRQVCSGEKASIAEPSVGNFSGRERASALSLKRPGM